MDNIIIIGSSGHAKVITDIVEQEGKYQIVGFIDDYREIGESVLNYNIIGKIYDLPQIIKKYDIYGGLVGIGDNFNRSKEVRNIKTIVPEFKFVSVIHPNANLSGNVSIGKGSVLMAGCSVNSCSKIGNFCILNTNSSLDHDSVMDDFSSLAPNCATGGNVTIGYCSAIGLGVSLKNRVKIGKNTVIEAGSVIFTDIGDNVYSYPKYVNKFKKRKENEPYL